MHYTHIFNIKIKLTCLYPVRPERSLSERLRESNEGVEWVKNLSNLCFKCFIKNNIWEFINIFMNIVNPFDSVFDSFVAQTSLRANGLIYESKKKLLCLVALFSTIFINLFAGNKADLVIFSYNRPLQLYALLESIEKYVKNLGETHIIFRADHDYLDAYKEVEKRFNHYKFHQQGNDPYSDFKILTLEYTFNSPEEYIIYAVDDIIVKDEIDILQCTQALKLTNAYGFYLRLGLNIKESYMMFINPTPLPEYNLVDNNICMYTFNNSCGDWRYPNTVDMTIYKKEDIKNDLLTINMVNPTTFEYYWHHLSDYNKKGLFFAESKILNIPLNLCYSQSTNRNMGLYSNQELLTKFKSGLKIDISQFYKINNNSPHMEYVPQFIER